MKLKHYLSCFLLLVCSIVQAQNKGEYTVSYNGNGATSGSMTNHTFTIGVDEETKLDANQYERKYNVSFNTQGGSDIAPKVCVYDFVKWAHTEVLTDVTKNMVNWYNICSNGNTGQIYKDLFTITSNDGVNNVKVLTRGSTRERLYSRPLYMPAGDYEVDFKFNSPSGYTDLGKEWEINFKMAAVDVPQIDYGNDYGMLTKGDEKSAVLLKNYYLTGELEDRALPIYANGETPVYLSVNCGNVSDGRVNEFNFTGFVFKKDGSSTLYYSDEEPTKNMVREDSGSIALSAVWEANNIVLPLPEKSGAEFVEWNTKADGTGAAYNAGDNFTAGEDIILYAIWKSGTPDDGALSKPCGEGTPECPYHITNANELLYFAAVVNGDVDTIAKNESAHGVLDNDIDLSTVCGPEIGSWTPIGLNPVSFKGVFDGRNHRIKNIYMNGSTVEGQGLFGIGSRCVIKNVVIESGVISANGPAVGAIGGVISGQIINCHNYATVINSKKFNGGIVGYMSPNSLLQRCHNEGTITSISSDKSQFGVGGIAGAVSTNTLVTDCYNLGDITGNSSRVGGVIGSAENCHVTNCYSIADVESRPNDFGGGLCAVIYDHYPNTVVEHSYYYNRLQGSSQQLDMWHPVEEFEDGTIYKELDEKSPNLWRQEEGKYPVFIDTVFASEKYQLKRVTICKGDSIAFDGQVFKTAGTYYAGGNCKCGGDTLVLTVAEPSTFELNETIKEGESYTFGNKTLTESGTYTRTIEGGNINGCDSIITLKLTVNKLGPVCIPVYDSIITSICDGDTFQFAGKDLTATGIYADTTLAANGCDSTTVLNLTVHPNTTQVIRDTISAGDNYSSNGFSLDAIETLGEYTFYNTVGLNQYGCDSIAALHLHVRKPKDGIFIPTLFTPYNKDGINDQFMKGYDVMIWDRYGNLICSSNDGWDGTYRGATADPGVYIYIVTLKDGRKKKGSIEVFKED